MRVPRVLVVDDEVGICLVIKDVLELEGCEVEFCHDAESAAERLAESSFDVALVDVFLSDRPTGIALAKRILSDFPATSLVLMTGYAEEADVQQGYLSGAYACIRKPFTIDDVIRVVGMAVDARERGTGDLAGEGSQVHSSG